MCNRGELAFITVTSSKMMMSYCLVSGLLIASLTLMSHYSVFSFAQSADKSDNNLKLVKNNISSYNSNKGINDNASLLYQVKIGNTVYPVGISSNGRQVNNLLYDTDEKSILLIMEPADINSTSNNGILVVDIPRAILDSQINNRDQNFTVTIDGHPTKFIENTKKVISDTKSNSTKDNTTSLQNFNYIGDTRKLAIEFAQDSKIIRIIGTDINESRNQGPEGGQERILRTDIPFNTEKSFKFISIYLDGATIGFSQFLSNSSSKILLLSIMPYREKGTLVVDIPRAILDSQINNRDQNFTVTIDGHPTKFIENTKKVISDTKSNSTKDNTTSLQNFNYIGDTRKLAIEFAQDSKIIRIIGTDINESRNKTNQTNQISINNHSVYPNNAEQQNFLIATVSALTGVIVAFVYFLHRKNKIRFTGGDKR